MAHLNVSLEQLICISNLTCLSRQSVPLCHLLLLGLQHLSKWHSHPHSCSSPNLRSDSSFSFFQSSHPSHWQVPLILPPKHITGLSSSLHLQNPMVPITIAHLNCFHHLVCLPDSSFALPLHHGAAGYIL